jgi:hypothetical protein
MLNGDAMISLIFSTSSGKYVPDEAQATSGGFDIWLTGKIWKLNETTFEGLHENAPKHLLRIRMYSWPWGDHRDIVTSSRRDGLANETLTEASVTEDPESRVLKSEELQTTWDDRGERTDMCAHVDDNGATEKWGP